MTRFPLLGIFLAVAGSIFTAQQIGLLFYPHLIVLGVNLLAWMFYVSTVALIVVSLIAIDLYRRHSASTSPTSPPGHTPSSTLSSPASTP